MLQKGTKEKFKMSVGPSSEERSHTPDLEKMDDTETTEIVENPSTMAIMKAIQSLKKDF